MRFEKTLSNLQEVKAREGKVIAVVTEGDGEAARVADEAVASTEHDLAVAERLDGAAQAVGRGAHRGDAIDGDHQNRAFAVT